MIDSSYKLSNKIDSFSLVLSLSAKFKRIKHHDDILIMLNNLKLLMAVFVAV